MADRAARRRSSDGGRAYPVTEEVASLWTREANARQDTNEAKEKLTTLAERACLDAVKTERLWKERDELLQTSTGLQKEHDDALR
jgi:hypothetical protein